MTRERSEVVTAVAAVDGVAARVMSPDRRAKVVTALMAAPAAFLHLQAIATKLLDDLPFLALE